jgi:EAL domain-containing protein (putative c-di-GMP-specific phosphodiesterase class I)/GGDEF domain-containing protein
MLNLQSYQPRIDHISVPEKPQTASTRVQKSTLADLVTRFIARVNHGQVAGLMLMHVDLRDRIATSFGREYTRQFCRAYVEKLRRYLPEGTIVIRLTGRRIAIAIARDTVSEITDTALSIVDRVEPRIQLGEDKFTVDISMGLAMYPTHADDGETLVRRTELTLQRAVDAGLPLEIYETGASGFQRALWKFETELKEAIRDDQLEVHYQPQYSLAERRVIGAEALVRWRNQSGDLIPAAEFVPAAERSGAITPLTWLVFEQVAKAAARLEIASRPFSVSINVPAQVLTEPEFFERLSVVRAELMRHQLSLVVELTEDSLMQTDRASLDVLGKIRSSGVGLSIDDFGKGYSSLNYLRQIPATELKIDREFVRAVAIDEKDKHIVKTAIELAKAFEMHSTAEGVDSLEVLDVLADMNCDVMQGYFIGRPMALEALDRWFRGNTISRLERSIASRHKRREGTNMGHLAAKR